MKRYTGSELNTIAYPMGGIGAGMLCLEGTGMLGQFSLRNEPDVQCEPNVFSSVCVLGGPGGNIARVLEGPVPYRKVFGGSIGRGAGNGLGGKNYGLPRMASNDFGAAFPFAALRFTDEKLPLEVSLEGFSPFLPLNEDDSSLPVAALEYTFKNTSEEPVRAVYSFNAFNFMKTEAGGADLPDESRPRVYGKKGGFMLAQPPLAEEPWAEGAFYAAVDDAGAAVDTDWFDGGHFDVQTMLWKGIEAGEAQDRAHPKNLSPGGAVRVPFTLAPGQSKTIALRLAWYVPRTRLRNGWEQDAPDCVGGCCCAKKDDRPTHVPWYAARFASAEEVMAYFAAQYGRLKTETRRFTDTFYDSTLPPEILDSIAANLTILKSPTVLRQTDGRIWAWEGCCDATGCCSGSCTHVWNYAMAMCHLFPALERSLRQTEFNENQAEDGHQTFRASLPIRPAGHSFHAACDGQLGGIMKMYREWRIGGDTEWLASYYGKMQKSLDYCIAAWDPDEAGVLVEPHHNTYDIEFWGPDGMCTCFYAGALAAMVKMGEALGKEVERYRALYAKSRRYLQDELFNGEYFIQRVEWKTLRAKLDLDKEAKDNPQARQLLETEGPKYQYAGGCISDGVLGAWMAKMCGLGDIVDTDKLVSHLMSVYRYNFKASLAEHANPQRPGYALGDEGGLLLCSWPRGGKPSLPFIYSDEVWTGIEHQVAAHLMDFGRLEEGLEIERAVRGRYNGVKRNPFNEYECGHWYARALSSYGMLQSLTGVRYDAVDKTLYVSDKNIGEYRSFLCTAFGYGTVSVKDGKAELSVAYGDIPVEKTVFEAS